MAKTTKLNNDSEVAASDASGHPGTPDAFVTVCKMTQPEPVWVPKLPRADEPWRVYIASTFERANEVHEAAAKIRAAGHEVVDSTWLIDFNPGMTAGETTLMVIKELERANAFLWVMGSRSIEDVWEIGWAFARGHALGRVGRPLRDVAACVALVPEYASVEAWLESLEAMRQA